MIRSIYAASRLPGMSREQFVRRWRQHGALAMGLPDFWDPIQRYAHGDAACASLQVPDGDTVIDGLGQIWWRSIEERTASMTSQSLSEQIGPDGDKTMQRSLMRNVVIDEQVVRDTGSPMPLRLFVLPLTSMTKQVPDWLSRSLRALEQIDDNTCGLIIAGEGYYPQSWFGGSIELGFARREDIAAGYDAWKRLVDRSEPDLRDLLTGATMCVVHQRYLYDRAECETDAVTD